MEHKSSRAYYMSRVDEEGNDIEMRPTTRSTEMMLRMSSARTFDMPPMSTRSSSVSSRASSRSVQYINQAVYIEKNADDARSTVSGSTMSIPSAANSDIVPPLDLQSECFPTRREGYTFSYRHNGEPSKLKENPALAYENWLSAKRKILSDKAAKRKQEEEAKVRQKEERRRLAAEKYQKWLEAKQLEKLKQKPKQKFEHQPLENRPPADERKIQEKIEEWERNKRLEDEHRREMKRLEKERRELEEQKRRQLSKEAWNKWITEAPKKPKPVPLNRGLFTLRGTISDIFINPNEWKSGDGL